MGSTAHRGKDSPCHGAETHDRHPENTGLTQFLQYFLFCSEGVLVRHQKNHIPVRMLSHLFFDFVVDPAGLSASAATVDQFKTHSFTSFVILCSLFSLYYRNYP